MRKKLLYSLIFAGSTLLAVSTGVASAQTGSGASHGGSTGAGAGNGAAGTAASRTADTMGQAGSASSGPVAKVNDARFAKEAAVGGMFEVQAGQLAAQKASADGVKQFGQKMVDDHTKANDDLKSVASKGSMELPTTLDAKHQARLDKLSKLSGTAFDKAYVKDQLKDHQMDVKEFQAESQGGTNPDVKDFATKTLPVLQQHLEMVKTLSKGGKDAKMGS